MTVRVEDDSKGSDPQRSPTNHFGVRITNDRDMNLASRLEIEFAPAKGTLITRCLARVCASCLNLRTGTTWWMKPPVAEVGASDLFTAADFPPSIKVHGGMTPLTAQKLDGDTTAELANLLMNACQREEFAKEMECNFAISVPGVSRFRVNVFVQQQYLCTLHENNANQTIDRIINFFPEERRNQLLMDLSANMRAIVSQRLVRTEDGNGRCAAVEILLNAPSIAERIFKGAFNDIKALMDKSR